MTLPDEKANANEVWSPGLCANCLEQLEPALVRSRGAAFCDAFCQRRAEDIRYVRRAIRDGRIARNAAWDGGMTAAVLFNNKIVFFAHDIAYTREHLPPKLRAEVLSAHDGLCVVCEEERATEVDHITGGSQERDNLRGLCRHCHETKPRGAIPEDLTRGGLEAVDTTQSNPALLSAWQAAIHSLETYDSSDPSIPWAALRSEADQLADTRFGSLTLALLDDEISAPAHSDEWTSAWPTFRSRTLHWARTAQAPPETRHT